jgi:hypothetical protein
MMLVLLGRGKKWAPWLYSWVRQAWARRQRGASWRVVCFAWLSFQALLLRWKLTLNVPAFTFGWGFGSGSVGKVIITD